MSAESNAEFLNRGAVPFALEACKRFDIKPIDGYYDEGSQIWRGANLLAAATATYTSTPGDSDGDQD